MITVSPSTFPPPLLSIFYHPIYNSVNIQFAQYNYRIIGYFDP
nr:MAG TPA: hypothetical protein [Caudoviricetes sp.]